MPRPAAVCCTLAALAAGAAGESRSLPPPLDLDIFEDADCLEHDKAPELLKLLNEMCDLLDSILASRMQGDGISWRALRVWADTNGPHLMFLVSTIVARPYCEPVKVAGIVSTCLLTWGDAGASEALQCAEEIEGFLGETAPDGASVYQTRLHLFLRSPWPAFRLLDAFVRLHPSTQDPSITADSLGACIAHRDLYNSPHQFDWQWYKDALIGALDTATGDPTTYTVDPAEGPLYARYRARWMRVYRTPQFREAAAFGSDVFFTYRRNQWEAGCHPGVVAAYLVQIVTFCMRDTEGWLHRYVGAGWRLLKLLTPLTSLIHTDWPVFRALHFASLLRRQSAPWLLGKDNDRLPVDGRYPSAAELLQTRVRRELSDLPDVVYVTAVWGPFERHLRPVTGRLKALQLPLLVLTLDDAATERCKKEVKAGMLACVEAPKQSGLEAAVVKYLVLAVVAAACRLVVWFDLDVYLSRDPTSFFSKLLSHDDGPLLAFEGPLNSKSLSSGLIAARGGDAASGILLHYGAWLYENPFVLDHQGWDSFLQNRGGDYGSGWDYKGRNVSAPDDGLEVSFAPPMPAAQNAIRREDLYVRLGHEFGSCDGWVGAVNRLLGFHFWGAEDDDIHDLFKHFYPFERPGFSAGAGSVLARYLREPLSRGVFHLTAPDLRLTTVTYADGCCAQAIARNRQSAIDVGIEDARALGRDHLDPYWREKYADVLSQKKGGGWWLWKPRVIFDTLLDPQVPWDYGVVLWLDAGNYWVANPRPFVAEALAQSDVVGLRLKCCMESDWTSAEALTRLGGAGYVIADRPQLGAYFLILRKTARTFAFMEDWMRMSEERGILMDSPDAIEENMKSAPGYQRHMADQSIFSVLYKQQGFQSQPLEEGHKYVKLDRWRE